MIFCNLQFQTTHSRRRKTTTDSPPQPPSSTTICNLTRRPRFLSYFSLSNFLPWSTRRQAVVANRSLNSSFAMDSFFPMVQFAGCTGSTCPSSGSRAGHSRFRKETLCQGHFETPFRLMFSVVWARGVEATIAMQTLSQALSCTDINLFGD